MLFRKTFFFFCLACNREEIHRWLKLFSHSKNQPYCAQSSNILPGTCAQVLTACLKSYAHGANDTANAAGPFAAVQALYMQGLDDCGKVSTPIWVLVFCGMGIVAVRISFPSLMQQNQRLSWTVPASNDLALSAHSPAHKSSIVTSCGDTTLQFLSHSPAHKSSIVTSCGDSSEIRLTVSTAGDTDYPSCIPSFCQSDLKGIKGLLFPPVLQGLGVLGHRVMETVGRDITDINFSRGFAIELGSTLSVVLASVAGKPI